MAGLTNFYNMKYKSNAKFLVYIKIGTNERLLLTTVKDVTLPKLTLGTLELKYGNVNETVMIPKYGTEDLQLDIMEDSHFSIYSMVVALKHEDYAPYDYVNAGYIGRADVDIEVDELSMDNTRILIKHIFNNCKLSSNDALVLDYQNTGPTFYNLSFAYQKYIIQYTTDNTMINDPSLQKSVVDAKPVATNLNLTSDTKS